VRQLIKYREKLLMLKCEDLATKIAIQRQSDFSIRCFNVAQKIKLAPCAIYWCMPVTDIEKVDDFCYTLVATYHTMPL